MPSAVGVGFSATVIEVDQTRLGKGRVQFTLHLTVHHEETSGEELKAGTKAESVGRGLLLLGLLFSVTQDHVPRWGIAQPTVVSGLPHQSFIKKMP